MGAVGLAQGRRAVDTAGYRSLDDVAVVVADFAKVAVLVALEKYLVVARAVLEVLVGEVVERDKVTVEDELVTAHAGRVAAALGVFCTQEEVEVVLVGKAEGVVCQSLCGETLAARGAELVCAHALVVGLLDVLGELGACHVAFFVIDVVEDELAAVAAVAGHCSRLVCAPGLVVVDLAGEGEVLDGLPLYRTVNNNV